MYTLNDLGLDMQRVRVADRRAEAANEQRSALARHKPWWRRHARARRAPFAQK